MTLLPLIEIIEIITVAIANTLGYCFRSVLSLYPTHESSCDEIKIGSLFQMSAYALQALALPFPVFLLSFPINGIGMALQVRNTPLSL